VNLYVHLHPPEHCATHRPEPRQHNGSESAIAATHASRLLANDPHATPRVPTAIHTGTAQHEPRVIDLTADTPPAPQSVFGASSLYMANDIATGSFTRPIGRGLFANRRFRANDTILAFRGEVITFEEANLRIHSSRGGYMVALRGVAVLDCYNTVTTGACLASLANTANGLRHAATGRSAVNNARISVSGGTVVGWRITLVATRRIIEGQEILAPYSGSYVMPAPTAPQPNALQATRAVAKRDVMDLTGSSPVQPGSHLAVRDAVLRHRSKQSESQLPIFVAQRQDDELLRVTAAAASACMTALFGDPTPVRIHDILTFLQEAHRAASDTYGVLAAIEWGGDFEFPQHLIERDSKEFEECGRSIELVAATRRARSLNSSFSLERVQACFGVSGDRIPDLPIGDFARLCRLATVGVELPLPRRFKPCNIPSALRTKYMQVRPALHRILTKQVEPGQVLLLTEEAASQHQGIHLGNIQHWTTKKGKPQGRSIADMSNVEDPTTQCPLNGATPDEKAEVNSACDAMYGPIKHPTLHELMLMVLAVADEHGWENISLWKMDLQGAFNLLWFNPAAAPLLAFPLAAGLVAVHLVGLFGWAGMPSAFQVLARALEVLVRYVIRGKSRFYVDDCMGCSPTAHLQADLAAAYTQIVALAGDNAVAADKTESGRSLEFIGWQVCLNSRTVCVSPRNLLKTAHAFFCFAPRARLSRMHVERMASLASRLSILCRFMRPFTRALAREATLFGTNPAVRRALSTAAHCEIAVWRAFCVLLRVRESAVSRPIESFRCKGPSVAIRYDASLTQIAVGVYELDRGQEQLLCFTALMLPFPTSTDSSRQNTYEYLAVLLGLLLLAHLNKKDFTFKLYGDSVSSLAWITADRVASLVARRANMAMVVLSVFCNAHVSETIHVPGVDNVVYDGLSRGKSATEVGLNPTAEVVLPTEHPITRFIQLCDPGLPIDSPEECIALIGNMRALLTTSTTQEDVLPTRYTPSV
jgi:hypothetical protein